MKISFLICTHNEGKQYLEPLFNQIGEFCNTYGDEFVILDDMSTDEDTLKLIKQSHEKYNAKVILHPLYDGTEYHFGRHKTIGSRACTGDWIFLIDGDELISDTLLQNLREILESNESVDLIKVPRLNEVIGMTVEDVRQWGWRITSREGKDYINYPDFQNRLYRNNLEIFWKNRLHEQIEGAKVVSELPAFPELSLIHIKTIDRQKSQNMFYNQNFSENENRGHK